MNKAYIRVSTTRQSKEGISLQAQKEKIKSFLSGEPVKFFKDVGSGRNGNRKNLKKLLQDLKPGDKVIVFRLDRISRSVADLSNLLKIFEKKKVDFISCMENFDTNSASGKAWFSMLCVFAEFESNVISERTKIALALTKSKGQVLGTVPFGFDRKKNSKKLVENLQEKKVIQMMQKLRRTGLSYENIALQLDQHFISSKNGCHWHGANVSRILKRTEAK